MKPGRYDLVIVRGDKFELTFRVKVNNAIVNYSGHDAKATLRDRNDQVIHTADSTSGIVLGTSSDEASALSWSKFTIPATTTDDFPLMSDGYWDIEVWPTGELGEAQKPLRGMVKVLREATLP